MTEIQQKLLELLCDLDTICQRENIPYYLSGHTALSAYTRSEFFPDCCQASVSMTPENAIRFLQAVRKEGRSDRITDSMFSNKNYPDFTLRFCDPNTLMIPLPYCRPSSLPYIGIVIHMIRTKPAHMNKIYQLSHTFWRASTMSEGSVSGFTKHVAVSVCRIAKNILGGKYFSRLLFRFWVSLFQFRETDKPIAIASDAFHYEPALVKGAQTVALEGKVFPIFADPEGYLLTAYGEDYSTVIPKYYKPSASLLASVNISFRQFVETAKERNLDLKTIQKKKTKCDLLQAKVSFYNRQIDRYYAIVERTEKRYALYETYMPMKEELLRLDREERYEELNDLLKPYRSALWAFYKKKLGLCFDREIFDLTMKILVMEGQEKYAKNLRALVPDEHWKPIVITDYKGDPIEC